jgi:hypothetical protein
MSSSRWIKGGRKDAKSPEPSEDPTFSLEEQFHTGWTVRVKRIDNSVKIGLGQENRAHNRKNL